MEAVTLTQISDNIGDTMNKVCQDHNPIIITRNESEPVVMISLDDYNSIEETLFLLRSPKNASKLFKGMEDIKNKNYFPRDLIEE